MRPQNIRLALLLFVAAAPLVAQVPKNNLDVHHPPSRPSSMETKSDHCFRSILENDRAQVFKVDVAASNPPRSTIIATTTLWSRWAKATSKSPAAEFVIPCRWKMEKCKL
jgi:hypothetical protein